MTNTLQTSEENNLKEYFVGEQEERPWGFFEVLDLGMANNEEFCEKKIIVKPRQALSLQRHKFRHEIWRVKQGTLTAVLDGKMHTIQSGDTIMIPLQSVHCMINLTDEDVIISERQMGICREEDNERLCDVSGRETSLIHPEDVNALRSKELYENITKNL